MANIPLCTTRQCLEQHEGQVIDIEGTYVFPREKAFAVSRLAFEDGTKIVIGPPAGGLFTSENDGAVLRVRGRIFTGPIPEKYGIIGRTPEPRLLDVEDIKKIERD